MFKLYWTYFAFRPNHIPIGTYEFIYRKVDDLRPELNDFFIKLKKLN